MSSEALTALKRSRSQCFRARDVDGLRVVLSQAEALQTRSPEPGLDTLIAALEQNILVLGGEAERPGPPPVAMPAAPRLARLPEPPQPAPAAEAPQPAAVPEPVVFAYSGWGRRFTAWLVDWVILAVLIDIVSRVLDPGAGGWGILAVDVGLIAAYFTVCHGSRRGQTVGKAILGIAVRDALACRPIDYITAFNRWLVGLLFWISVIAGILDGFSPLWNDRKQAWHDRAVSTVVVRV